MTELARLFFNIALLRQGPQDVPESKWLLAMLLAVSFALYALIIAAFGLAVGPPLAEAVLNTALTLLLTAAILSIASRAHRFVQTVTAMIGAELMLFPLLIVLLALGKPYRALSNYPEWLQLIQWAYFAWDVVIIGHIYRSALERSLVVGVLLSFVCAIIVISTVTLVFPLPSP